MVWYVMVWHCGTVQVVERVFPPPTLRGGTDEPQEPQPGGDYRQSVVPQWHYGAMILWRYNAMALRHYGTMALWYVGM